MFLGNVGTISFLIKATHNTRQYDNNPDRMGGCVCYESGTIPYFRLRTIIEPDNQFEVTHYQLSVNASRSALQVCGPMEETFEDQLRIAVENSITLDRKKKLWLSCCLPWIKVP